MSCCCAIIAIMRTEDIILWTFSITLAIVGIVFGVIASLNSKKSNDTIKELMHQQHTQKTSRDFFLDKLKVVIKANRRAIKHLEVGDVYYDEYNYVLEETRLPFISKNSTKVLIDGGYVEHIAKYTKVKHNLETVFADILKNNYGVLEKHILVDDNSIVYLTEYHQSVIDFSSNMMKSYIRSNEGT